MESSNFSSSLNRPTHSNNISMSAAGAPPFKRTRRPLFIPHGQVAFRFLCPASRVGGLIGKSGSIVKQLQQLTNSTIRVETPNSSVEYRVITIIGSPVVSNKIQAFVANELKGEGEGEVEIKEDGNEWFDVSAAQEGILRVFERVLEVAAEGHAEATTSGVVSCRLLAGKNQVGAVTGKGSMVVKKIRRDTGCKIKVLVSEKLPSGPFQNEEILEIEGDVLGVKKALIAVTGRLQEFHPPPERTRVNVSRPFEAESFPVPTVDRTLLQNPVLHPMASNSVTNSSGNKPSILHSETISNPEFTKRPQEVVFKILWPNARVGSIIGKGGSIIKTLESESGASINIGPVVAECNERLITIRAMENVDSQYSPVQKAAVLIFSRCMKVSTLMGLDSDSQGSLVLARVVVPTNQVGSLLGKGGVIISEMRKVTGTGLKIIGGNQVPKCVSENVEVLEITGEFANVQDALHRVVGRLRDNISTLQMSNGSSNRDSFRIKNSNQSRLRVPPALGSHQPFVTLNNLNEQESLTQKMDNLGISNNIVHPPVLLAPDNIGTSNNIVRPPLSLAPKPVSGANAGNVTDTGGKLPSNKGGVKLGRSAIVTSTTVEIAVPENIISSIFGENGSNLARLRQISGAKVVVHEPRPETSDRVVVISGSPHETLAAQSLLQAFMIS